MGDAVPFPIASFSNVIIGAPSSGVFGVAQYVLNVFWSPDEKFPFDSFAVGIRGRIKPPFWAGHFPENVVEGFGRHATILRILGDLVRLHIGSSQECVIIEHFLEMWHKPVIICGIAGKASADVVIDAAVSQTI